MPIEIIVDDINQVDEPLRGAYIEADGKFQLDPDRYAEYKAAGLKKKNSELIGKEKQLKSELARFEKFKEIDPDDLDEFFESRNNPPAGDSGKGKDAGAVDAETRKLLKQIEKLEKKYSEDGANWQAERERMDAELKHYKLTVPLKEIALKAGVLPDDVDLALMETAKRFRLDDSGKILVVDEDGDPTTDTPERFFKEIYREQRPKFYAATGAGGSGAKPGAHSGNSGQKTMTRGRFNELSHSERAKAVKAGIAIVD